MPDSLNDRWQSMAEAREAWPDLTQAQIDRMIGHAVHIDDGVTYVSRMEMPEPFMPNWLEPSDGTMLCPNDDCNEPMRWADDEPQPPSARIKPYEHEAYRRDENGEYPSAWRGPYNADRWLDYDGTTKALIGTPVAMQCKVCGQWSAILRRDRMHEVTQMVLSSGGNGTPSDKLTSMIIRALECERVDCTCLDDGKKETR